MFGCFRRLGCLVILLILGVLAWFNRERLEAVYRRYAGAPPAANTASVIRVPGDWERLSPEKGTAGERKVESLNARTGPAYVNLSASEAASYILQGAIRQAPGSTQQATSTVKGDRLYVRANLDLKALGASKALGALGSLLGDRDTVQLGGTIHVLRPGVGEFNVKDVKVGSFPVPSAMIPKLIPRLRKGDMPEGLSSDALPMKMPHYIGDVRISDGRITVYKNTQ
ncbi:MAG TPA: hypothetical protein VHM24_04785 [Gemmatimonadaceae bacterium]|nr:hypothetical protein [Gemmatimonadaceae bacterium]